ncbi:MAG TPA: TonB-dependent receptor [Thermoanaerobaculia bacterium]|nr:TonB-dependent receptor [Thermoanaerobaculia bacterium]
MSRRFRFPLCLLAAILALPAMAAIHDGSISGTVTDPEGNRIPAASLTLFLGGASRSTEADAGGRFLFTNVPAGDYPIQAEREGFETVVREAVHVSPASETVVTFALAPEPDQTVTLTEETPLLDPVHDAAGTTFSKASLNEVPRWLTHAALVDDVPGVVSASGGGLERLLFRSRGVTERQARWYLDSFDVTTSDPRLSAAVATPLRTSQEIRMITGGTDPALATSGLTIVSVVPRRSAARAGSIFVHGTDGGIGGSSSVPGNLRGTLVQADSIERSLEAGAGLGLPLIADRMWGWFSFGMRSVDGVGSRPAGVASSDFEERSRALYVHIDSQWTPQYAASLAVFHATREDDGEEPFRGKASGLQLHESLVANPRLFIQGSGSIVSETIQPFAEGDRWSLWADGSWIPAGLRRHQLEAGIEGGESDIEPSGGLNEERISIYVGDTFRMGELTSTASLRAESLQSGDRRFLELLPRASLGWRPGEGNTLLQGGYSRYTAPPDIDRPASNTVDEIFVGLERELAIGFLVTSRLVERRFDASEGRTRWRGLELGTRRRMSSGVYFHGQVSYMDSDREDALDAHWAYSFSAIAQIPMVGIGTGISLHGRDGFSRPGTGRLSDTWALDLRLSREFGERRPITFAIDLLNVTNERVLLLESGTVGSQVEVQQPRAVRFGVSAAF